MSRIQGINSLFDSIAGVYDAMNSLMSLGMDRSWRRQLISQAGVRQGEKVLDVCGGTGEVALEAANSVGPYGRVVCLDFSSKMLEKGRAKAKIRGYGHIIEFVTADALALPFDDKSFDRVTVAFGVRNLPDISRGFREMARVLRPGGSIGCLDLSRPTLPIFRQLYHLYFNIMVPIVGRLIYGARGPYDYLPASLAKFPVRGELAGLMCDAGFSSVAYRDLALGTVGIHTGVKD